MPDKEWFEALDAIVKKDEIVGWEICPREHKMTYRERDGTWDVRIHTSDYRTYILANCQSKASAQTIMVRLFNEVNSADL